MVANQLAVAAMIIVVMIMIAENVSAAKGIATPPTYSPTLWAIVPLSAVWANSQPPARTPATGTPMCRMSRARRQGSSTATAAANSGTAAKRGSVQSI